MVTGCSGYTIFCDDVRQEIGGKVTLVGMYAGRLITDIPVMLPKLSLFIIYQEKIGMRASKFNLQVLGMDNEVLWEQAFNSADGHVLHSDEPEPRAVQLAVPLFIMPFQIDKPGYISVRALRGKHEIDLGSLAISPRQIKSDASEVHIDVKNAPNAEV